MREHRLMLQSAPPDLLAEAATDVARRLPEVAAREPTRRHRKHFAGLLRWHQLLEGRLALSLKPGRFHDDRG